MLHKFHENILSEEKLQSNLKLFGAVELFFIFFWSNFPLSVTIPHSAAPLRSNASFRDFHCNRG